MFSFFNVIVSFLIYKLFLFTKSYLTVRCVNRAGATRLSSIATQGVQGCGDMHATVSPGLTMAILPCANPYGVLRVGRCDLKDSHGFWLFGYLLHFFWGLIRPSLTTGFSGFGRECSFCFCIKYCV